MALAPERWQPDHLRQMLMEATTEAAVLILVCGYRTIAKWRRVLNVEPPWAQRGSTWHGEVKRLTRERWSRYPDVVPAPLTMAELEEILETRTGKRPAKPLAFQLDPELVIEAIRRYRDTHNRDPDEYDLAQENGWDAKTVYNLLFYQRHRVRRDHRTETYSLIEPPEERTYTLSAEEVAAMIKPRKLPPDAELLQEVEGIKAAGLPIIQTLMERYGVPRGTVSSTLYTARHRAQYPPKAPELAMELPKEGEEEEDVGNLSEAKMEDPTTRLERAQVEAIRQTWAESDAANRIADQRRKTARITRRLCMTIPDDDTLAAVLELLREEGVA